MAVFGEPEGKTVFSLSPGRHFDEEIYYETQEELERLGWSSISHTYDVEKGIKTVEDHALQRDYEIANSGAKSSINVGWSWSANNAIWPSTERSVEKIILVGGAFHPDVVTWAEGSVPTASHDLRYGAYEHNPGPEAFLEIAKTHIFTEITDEEIVLKWAKKMRHHPIVAVESKLETPPRVPIDDIILTKDRALLNQAEIARGLSKKAKVTVRRFESDHAPMVYRPRDFANLLVRRAVAVTNVPTTN